MTPDAEQPREPDPTPQQLTMMAWLDGELAPGDRLEFEQQMVQDPALAAEAAAQKRIMDLTRSFGTLEPTEVEMRRFWTSFYNRNEWRLAWVLLTVGAVGLLGEGVFLLLTTASLTWLMKGAALCTLAGAALLIWNTARLRMRTSRFDRYRGVMR